MNWIAHQQFGSQDEYNLRNIKEIILVFNKLLDSLMFKFYKILLQILTHYTWTPEKKWF